MLKNNTQKSQVKVKNGKIYLRTEESRKNKSDF